MPRNFSHIIPISAEESTFVSFCSTMKLTQGLVRSRQVVPYSELHPRPFIFNFKAGSCRLPRLALPKLTMKPRHRQTLNTVLLCQSQDEYHQA